MNKAIKNFQALGLIALFFVLFSCNSNSKKEKGAQLYQDQCARCHIAPDINHLPKEFWTKSILPEMAARMGIKDGGFKPYDKMDFEEMEIIHNSGIYPFMPSLNDQDWALLKAYILEMAPDSLAPIIHDKETFEQQLFKVSMFSIDETPGSYFTYLSYKKENNSIHTGDISGQLIQYEFETKNSQVLKKSDNAVVGFTDLDSISFLTDIGILDPSELSSGKVIAYHNDAEKVIIDSLHRPVYNEVRDLNGDGTKEMLVSEFGHLTGKLSLMILGPSGNYEKKVLLSQPGTIRTEIKDLNNDGKLDIVALTSQGDESITFLYQQDNLVFRNEKVLRFSPIYGSSWFEILDYDGDGDDDIITVNGDNADKTYIHKPYHGLRIHLNDGENNFKEAFFFPLNGATRFVSNDFDQDGDIDFSIISTFPDYENKPEYSLIYLENKNEQLFDFEVQTIKEANDSRWFLLDIGDVDKDGDMDIIFSAFTYVFTPVPPSISEKWNTTNADIMILENTLIKN
ncbi:FG-GAP-like repeat-containing protein [Lutimonas sp.]|uniref:FG-GAP-like repeat-containing protein n=1 Tax=Lutimonas sp. TaxID=1872403 RepID=UPI003D9BF10D